MARMFAAIGVLTLAVTATANNLKWAGGSTDWSSPQSWSCVDDSSGMCKSWMGGDRTPGSVKQISLGSPGTKYNVAVQEGADQVVGQRIELNVGRLQLGTNSGGTVKLVMTTPDKVSNDAVSLQYIPGSGASQDVVGGPYDAFCHLNWRDTSDVTVNGQTWEKIKIGDEAAPCSGDSVVLADDMSELVYAVSYNVQDRNYRPTFVVDQARWTPDGDIMECAADDSGEIAIPEMALGSLQLGECGMDGSVMFIDPKNAPPGDCKSTCQKGEVANRERMEFKEHDSEETWHLFQFQDEWDSDAMEWVAQYRAVSPSGAIDPTPVTNVVFSVDENGDDHIEFDYVSVAELCTPSTCPGGKPFGRVHTYSGTLLAGKAIRHTTITSTTETETSTTATNTTTTTTTRKAEASMAIAPVAGGAGGAFVILIVVLAIIVMKRRSSGDPYKGRAGGVGTISFENPLYDDNGAANPAFDEDSDDGAEDLYDDPDFQGDDGEDDGDGLYDEPEFEGGGGQSGYMDVNAAADDDDEGDGLYDEPAFAGDEEDVAGYQDIPAATVDDDDDGDGLYDEPAFAGEDDGEDDGGGYLDVGDDDDDDDDDDDETEEEEETDSEDDADGFGNDE